MIVLVGFMGAGKSTVGRSLADRLGLPFLDSDTVIEERAGRSIAQIFASDGESAFRALEAATIADLLDGPSAVLALGGGACGNPTTRGRLAGHTVVHLEVSFDQALARVGADPRRPVLAAPDLADRYAARQADYARVATVTVRTDARRPGEVAAEIAAALAADAGRAAGLVHVGPDGPGGYDVLVGPGASARLPGLVPAGAVRALVVHTRSVATLAEGVRAMLGEAGCTAYLAEVPDAEAAKTAQVAASLWSLLGQAGFTRTDLVVGVGGGAVTDLAGFVAASWLRGVPVIQVPTTLAGMVDAAVGGKTGINIAEGKNLVGAFHPPAAVLCDTDTLRTLPAAELLPGMAEVVKHGFIADPRTLELIEADPVVAVDPTGPVLPELVERSVRVKAHVVTEDLRESSLREILNYGHTFGHAVEQVEGYLWRHGSAVSVGLVYAAALGRLSGRTSADLAQRHTDVLASVGLPVRYPDAAGERWSALLTAMSRDKKTRGATLRFVVLDGLAQPGRLEGPSEDLLRAAYREVAG